jgi:hypothetical protein
LDRSSPEFIFGRCLLPLSITVAVLAAGCGASSEGPPTYPVSGKLLVDGQPAEGAQVILHPADGRDFDQRGSRPTGRVTDDGTFHVTTYELNDGAPAGRYVVTVYWAQDPDSLEPSPDRLKQRFLDPQKSDLHVEVTGSATEIPPIELHSP